MYVNIFIFIISIFIYICIYIYLYVYVYIYIYIFISFPPCNLMSLHTIELSILSNRAKSWYNCVLFCLCSIMASQRVFLQSDQDNAKYDAIHVGGLAQGKTFYARIVPYSTFRGNVSSVSSGHMVLGKCELCLYVSLAYC